MTVWDNTHGSTLMISSRPPSPAAILKLLRNARKRSWLMETGRPVITTDRPSSVLASPALGPLPSMMPLSPASVRPREPLPPIEGDAVGWSRKDEMTSEDTVFQCLQRCAHEVGCGKCKECATRWYTVVVINCGWSSSELDGRLLPRFTHIPVATFSTFMVAHSLRISAGVAVLGRLVSCKQFVGDWPSTGFALSQYSEDSGIVGDARNGCPNRSGRGVRTAVRARFLTAVLAILRVCVWPPFRVVWCNVSMSPTSR